MKTRNDNIFALLVPLQFTQTANQFLNAWQNFQRVLCNDVTRSNGRQYLCHDEGRRNRA